MIQLLDKWSKNLWIYFICIIGVVTGIYLILNWGDLSVGARGAAFCAMIMPLHVTEALGNTAASGLVIGVGVLIGLALILYAQFKYNKGLF